MYVYVVEVYWIPKYIVYLVENIYEDVCVCTIYYNIDPRCFRLEFRVVLGALLLGTTGSRISNLVTASW